MQHVYLEMGFNNKIKITSILHSQVFMVLFF
jgi:hypothetical protein